MNSTASLPIDGDAQAPGASRRGDRNIGRASVLSCRHCGAALRHEAGRTAGFCCAGCAYVFRLVHEHGLDGYYRIRDTVVSPADDAVFQPRDFGWLVAAQKSAEQTAGTPELVVGVQGISCAGCVWLIEKLFHEEPGALAIGTDAPLGRIRLRWAEGFDAARFARTLQSFGYTLGPAATEAPPLVSRALVRRIGLCAALAMNVMLFTLPVYFGMEATFPYARLFGLLSMTFATLSVLAGGGYFFARAWRALREGAMHIDLPISVGIAGAYAGSVYGWLAQRETFVYFDFVSAFILLMLVGRWAQTVAVERNRRRLVAAGLKSEAVTVVSAEGTRTSRPLPALRPGETIEVAPGELVPVTGQLLAASAEFGLAWISGESEARLERAGAAIPAGAVNLGRTAVQLRAAQTWSESLLSRLLQPATRAAYRHRFLERVVAGYLVAIFFIAVAAGAGWWLATRDAVRAWATVTAVLVVSCPCALGLAFPLADEIATTALRRTGVFVREADLWPRLARIRRIIFDKTGTLTLETPVLQNPSALDALDPSARAALQRMVADSLHPVAQSLRQHLLAGDGAASAADQMPPGEIREEPGFGLTMRWNEVPWSLGRPGWHSRPGGPVPPAGHAVAPGDTEFRRDGVLLASFRFSDAVRPGALEEISRLRADGFAVAILSGDRPAKVERTAGALGLPLADAHGNLSPVEKAAWIDAHDARDTLMLGDGANDSLAFDAAFARGTPLVHRGVLTGKADFYFVGRGLEGVRALFAVDADRRRTHRWLLVFSIAYNLVAVGLAVAGRMHPLLAAILMPVSSVATLAIVSLGMRRVVRGR